LNTVNSDEGTSGIFYGWKIVAALFIILVFTSGLGFYNHSVILTALSREVGFPLGLVSGAVSVFFFTTGIAGLIIGSLLERYDVRFIIAFGSLLASVSLGGMGYVTEIWQLYLLYFFFGIGFSASGFLPATTLIARWFDKSRARALSVASTGLSVGGVILTPISASLVANEGIAGASPWLGFLYFAGVFPVCIFVLRSTPSDIGLQADGGKPEMLSAEGGIRFAEAIRQKYFWTLSVSYLFVMLAQVGAITHQYGIVGELLEGREAAYAIGVLPLFSILGRLAGGVAIDFLSTQRFTVVMMLLQAASFLLIAFAGSGLTLLAGLAVFGLTVGNLLMLQPLLIAEIYGLLNYSRIYSWSNLLTMLGVATGPALMGYLVVIEGTYRLSYTAAAVSSLVACLVFLFAKPPVQNNS
jgi:MFS family permease